MESEYGGTEHFSLRVGAALQDVVQAGVQAEREEFIVGAAKCTEGLNLIPECQLYEVTV